MMCRVAKSVMETEGVTGTAVMIANKGKSILLSHLDTWWFVWAIVASLRVKLLFLTTVSFMLLLTCFLDPLLALKSGLKGSRELVIMDLISPPGLQTVPLHLVNATIVAHAAVDPLEQVERKMISRALEYALVEGLSRQKQVRGHMVDGLAEQESRVLPMKGKTEAWEVELSRHLYARHWPLFQKLLKDWAHKKTRFEPAIMAELLDQVKAPLDKHYGTGGSDSQPTQRYKTCAVVGNSGVLLTSSQGRFIDSHDMVIRINMANTKDFTSHVGSKTTLSFINSNVLHSCAKRSSCPCHLLGGSVPVLTYMCTPVHLMDIARCTTAQRTVPLLVTDPRFDILSYRIVKWYSLTLYASRTGHSITQWAERYGGEYFHHSSGFQAVMLALGLCNEVDLFGFGKMAGVRHHYHSMQKEELSLHDYAAEYVFYNDVMHNRSASIPFLQDSGITMPPLRIFV